MSAKKILIVEDDRASAVMLSYRLRASGYTVVTAPDGTEAVGLIRSEHPDLMILDLGLPSKDPFNGPNWDGFGLMDWLNRLHPTDRLPIIVVTARDPIQAKKKSLEAGALAYFQKPAPFEQLLSTIKAALGETHTAQSSGAVPTQTQTSSVPSV